MTVLGIVLTVFCGLTAPVSASGKLTEQEAIVDILDHVRVGPNLRRLLPYLQMAGGLAALISLVVIPVLGVAGLVGLALYYAGAAGFHLRVGDRFGQYVVPLGLSVVAAVAAILRATAI